MRIMSRVKLESSCVVEPCRTSEWFHPVFNFWELSDLGENVASWGSLRPLLRTSLTGEGLLWMRPWWRSIAIRGYFWYNSTTTSCWSMRLEASLTVKMVWESMCLRIFGGLLHTSYTVTIFGNASKKTRWLRGCFRTKVLDNTLQNPEEAKFRRGTLGLWDSGLSTWAAA